MAQVPLVIPTQPFAPTGLFDRFASVEDLTPKFIKEKYLLGMRFVDALGNDYPDDWYEQKIAVAISHFEHYTNISITPHHIPVEMHDYFIRDYQQFCFLQLHHAPLIVTQDEPTVTAVYPTGQVVTTFPREWVRPDAIHGLLQLVPTQGTLSQVILGQGGSYLPIIYQGMGYLPQLFHVKYTAGFQNGRIPQIFLDAIAKLATIELLSVVGDTIRPTGLTNQSFSIDGMSESQGFQNSTQFAPVFSGRISQYKRELFGDPQLGIKGLFSDIKDYYRGVNLWVSV